MATKLCPKMGINSQFWAKLVIFAVFLQHNNGPLIIAKIGLKFPQMVTIS
jgi:hypothetical protein